MIHRLQNSLIIRNATVSDFKVLIESSSNDGSSLWHLNLKDLDVWRKSFEGSILLTAVDEGKPIGFCLATPHRPGKIVMIGCYFVLEEYRGSGVGTYLWNHVLNSFPGCNICLWAVSDMVQKYQIRCGLTSRNHGEMQVVCGRTLSYKTLDKSWQKNTLIKQIDGSNIGDVIKFDRSICGVERNGWCRKWLMDDHKNIGMAAFDTNGVVVGYGQIRRINESQHHLGPLYAAEPNVAKAILYELLEQRTKDKQHLNIVAYTLALDDKTDELIDFFIHLTQESEPMPFMFKYEDVKLDMSKVYFTADLDANFI